MVFLMTKRTGGMYYPKTNYKTSRHCVAYLDLLGGKNIILNDNKSEHLNKINMIFEDALRESKMFAHDIFVKIFSDNILLAVPTDDDNRKQNIEKIIVLVRNIVQEMADYEYLIRGALTEGDFFHNDIIVYGKALVEAVEMEEEYAIYPRVIVKKEIYELFPQYFYECADGWHSVNHYISGFAFDSFKTPLLQQLTNNKDNIKVRQKIMSAITDFNFINDISRKAGYIDCQIITRKEIENAVK